MSTGSNGSSGWDTKAHFEKAATTYAKQGGELTRAISRHLISISSPPLSSSSIVLDNGTGPGITCAEIVTQLPKDQRPKEVHATDLSENMIKQVELQGHTEIQASVMDAQDLKFPDRKFSHIYMAFVIFALPDVRKGASELYRTLQPGGSAYVTTWASLGWIPPVNRAVHRVKPDAPEYIGPLAEEWKHAKKLKDLLISGGFEETNVSVERFDTHAKPNMWEGAKEFTKSGVMDSFLAGWSETEKEKLFECLAEEFDKERNAGTELYMPAWVGVATK